MMGNPSSSPPIVTIVGRSRAGKTTLLEKLIPALKQRGFQIGTVKHHVHANFEIDKPGKDSWRHTQAGSDHVIISAPKKIASVRILDTELSLDEIAAQFQGVDIILAEGIQPGGQSSHRSRSRRSGGLAHKDRREFTGCSVRYPLRAIRPLFSPENMEPLAELIQATFL